MSALAVGRLESDRHELWKLGFLAATLYNAQPQFGKKKRKSVKPEDLLPALKEGARRKRKTQTPDQQLFLARMIHARFMAGRKAK